MASEKLLPAVAETLHSPPGRDLSFYLVLFVAVIPIWSVVPFSWAFVIYALHYGLIWNFSWRGWTVFAVALSEVRPSDHFLPVAPPLTRASCRSSSACTTTTSRASSPDRVSTVPATCMSFGRRSTAYSRLALLPCQKKVTTRKLSMSTDRGVLKRPWRT